MSFDRTEKVVIPSNPVKKNKKTLVIFTHVCEDSKSAFTEAYFQRPEQRIWALIPFYILFYFFFF